MGLRVLARGRPNRKPPALPPTPLLCKPNVREPQLMLRLYVHPTPNPAKIALFLEETGLPCEMVPDDRRHVGLGMG
jgi:hypothetical protein